MRLKTPKNTVAGFFLIPVLCFFFSSSDLSAAEIQAGAAGVWTGDTVVHGSAVSVMPVAAFYASPPKRRRHGRRKAMKPKSSIRKGFKAEFGAFQYTVDKTGNGASAGGEQVAREGELDIRAYSLAGFLVLETSEEVRLNIGAGVVVYQYDSKISEEAEAELAMNNITDASEEIADTIGFQLIAGADIVLTENLLLGLSCRMVNAQPIAHLNAVYSGKAGTERKRLSLSHEVVVLSLMYRFGL